MGNIALFGNHELSKKSSKKVTKAPKVCELEKWKQILTLCMDNLKFYMRRRKPDTIECCHVYDIE